MPVGTWVSIAGRKRITKVVRQCSDVRNRIYHYHRSIDPYARHCEGKRNHAWLQIKADVTGCRIESSAEPEATLLGAALVAGIGSGVYKSETEAVANLTPDPVEVFLPNSERHEAYRRLYEQGYLIFQKALRRYFNEDEFLEGS